MKIDEYFKYWDLFFEIWKGALNKADYEKGFAKLNSPFNQHTFCYPEQLLNTPSDSAASYDYIIEPYWGWTPFNGKKLEMVVVNYNPASGGDDQHRDSENIRSISNYSSYVDEQLRQYVDHRSRRTKERPKQYATSNWHFNNRAKKLRAISVGRHEDFSAVQNYLGIDLVPWHTKNVHELKGYLEENFESIKKWSLGFAIEAARHVEGKLKGKVIVRTNMSTFSSVFHNEFTSGYFQPGASGNHSKQNKYQEILIDGNNDVKIYLMWGMRNDLPTVEYMSSVFNG